MAITTIPYVTYSFNPWIGCYKITEGCRNCYAEHFASEHFPGYWGMDAPRRGMMESYWKEPLKWERKASIAKGERPRVMNSMCDIFEGRQDLDDHRRRFFDLIIATPHLDWLLFTKRPENIDAILTRCDAWYYQINRKFPDNVWLIVSVEEQKHLSRIYAIEHLKAAIKGISMEPMLEPIINIPLAGIDWVALGAESGIYYRYFSFDWARSVLGECRASGVPFYMKQAGGYPDRHERLSDFPPDLQVRELPKRKFVVGIEELSMDLYQGEQLQF